MKNLCEPTDLFEHPTRFNRTLDVDPHRRATVVVTRSARVTRIFVILPAACSHAFRHFIIAEGDEVEGQKYPFGSRKRDNGATFTM